MCSIQIKFKSPLNAPLKICSNWTCSCKLSPQLYDWPCEPERLEHELEHILTNFTNQLVGWLSNQSHTDAQNQLVKRLRPLNVGGLLCLRPLHCFSMTRHPTTLQHVSCTPSLQRVIGAPNVDCGLCLGHTAEDMQHSINMSVCSNNTSKHSTTQAKIGNVVQYAQWNHNHPVRHFDKLLKMSFGTKYPKKATKMT